MADTACRLLVATRNQGKLKELKKLLAGCPFTLVSLTDVGIGDEIPETGATFEENAILKATACARASGLVSLADDSGLEVDALGGEPGVMSSRYAGARANDEQRTAFLLEKLNNIPESRWDARFRCVIAVAWPGGPVDVYSGDCNGRIVRTPRGSGGFGYDPVFLLPELGKTMAELTPCAKNRMSHRAVATRKVVAVLAATDRRPPLRNREGNS